ncbi:MAG: LuxR C-terminal-related transcriptional regulator, partial [Moritella sp.]|uniref:LuxR C-terminal-related transcriptional regulator n=1 Tax=Moritella sp. TaxID=78556 RepID=UPI0029BF4A57
CYLKGDNQSSINFAEKALKDLAENAEHSRAIALCMLSFGHQISGDLASAYNVVYEAQESYLLTGTTYHSKMYLILACVHWLAADLTGLRQVCLQILKICEHSNLLESTSCAQHFLGALHYLRNNLKEADKYLQLVQKNYYKSTMLNAAHNAFVLALNLEGQGRSDEALEVVESTINKALESGSNGFHQLALGFQAELFLRQGKIAQAQKWSINFEAHPFDPGYRFYIPQFTYIKVLLSRETRDDLLLAKNLLGELHVYYGALHNNKCLIDVLLLQSVLNDKLGNESSSYKKLSEALALSESGELIRPFLDFGSQISTILKRYIKQETYQLYANRVLVAFGHVEPSAVPVALELMTLREIEILKVLSKGLSNQAIADSLFISLETVKRHLYNIFKKLGTKNRQQAITKARTLGII